MKATFYKGTALGAGVAVIVMAATSALAGTGIGGIFNLGQTNTVDAETALNGNAGGNPQLRVQNTSGGSGAFGVLGRITSGNPSAQSAGLRGINSAANANGYGVWGTHNASGVGVFGSAPSGTGVLGSHTNGAGTSAGVEGATSSTDPAGAGVIARNTGGGPGLSAIVNTGAPPLAVNSDERVANLNADLLDGVESDQMVHSPIAFDGPSNTPQTVIGFAPGTQVLASCSVTGDLSLLAKRVTSVGAIHETLTTNPGGGSIVAYRENDSLAVNTTFDLVGAADDNVIGTFISTNKARSAAVGTFMAEEESGHCLVFGNISFSVSP